MRGLGRMWWLAVPPLLVAAAVIIPFFFFGMFLRGVLLRVWFGCAHRVRGRSILFVYSDSPTWRAHIEEQVLPRLGNRALVLNWSQRARWRTECPWGARAVHHWGGQREFNPMALVFSGVWRVETIRFYRAFQDFKHGNDSALRQAESQLFAAVPPAHDR